MDRRDFIRNSTVAAVGSLVTLDTAARLAGGEADAREHAQAPPGTGRPVRAVSIGFKPGLGLDRIAELVDKEGERGADLIALPTNWVLGPGSLCTLEHVIHARALDNGVYFLAVNRVGVEGGFRFMGRSKLVGPDGQAIAECPPDAEAMIFADIDTSRSRAKHVVRIPGKHESHRLADRRPHMYSLLTEPHNLTSPWRH